MKNKIIGGLLIELHRDILGGEKLAALVPCYRTLGTPLGLFMAGTSEPARSKRWSMPMTRSVNLPSPTLIFYSPHNPYEVPAAYEPVGATVTKTWPEPKRDGEI